MMRLDQITDPDVKAQTIAGLKRKARLYGLPEPVFDQPKVRAVQRRTHKIPFDAQYGPPVWLFRPLKVRDIIEIAAQVGRVSVTDIQSKRREYKVARVRQIVLAAARFWTTASMPEIGQWVARRDHTTVIYAIKMVRLRRAARDPETLRICSDLAAVFDKTWPEPTEKDLKLGQAWKEGQVRKHQLWNSQRKNPSCAGASAGLVM